MIIVGFAVPDVNRNWGGKMDDGAAKY